jgi:hypothetical protein
MKKSQNGSTECLDVRNSLAVTARDRNGARKLNPNFLLLFAGGVNFALLNIPSIQACDDEKLLSF